MDNSCRQTRDIVLVFALAVSCHFRKFKHVERNRNPESRKRKFLFHRLASEERERKILEGKQGGLILDSEAVFKK